MDESAGKRGTVEELIELTARRLKPAVRARFAGAIAADAVVAEILDAAISQADQGSIAAGSSAIDVLATLAALAVTALADARKRITTLEQQAAR